MPTDETTIVRRRMRNQALVGERCATPDDVVRRLGAVQAQEFEPALWALGMRCRDHDRDAVRALVDDGRIVRTHALRPTWHFVAPEDLGWIQAVTGPRVLRMSAYYERQLGIDEPTAARAMDVFGQALADGTYLTRPELADALARAGVDAAGLRLAYLVMRAELAALVVNGPMRGKQHTYAWAADRIGPLTEVDPDAALTELVRRYVVGHGPATVDDLVWWASLTATQVKRGLAGCGDELVPVDLDGETYWSAAQQPEPPDDASYGAHLLQGYDEYVIAYRRSRGLTNTRGLVVAPPGTNRTVQPVLVDTQAVGEWLRTATRTEIRIEARLARSLSAAERAQVETAAEEYAAFVRLPLTLTIT